MRALLLLVLAACNGASTKQPTTPPPVDVAPQARAHVDAFLADLRADSLESHDRLLAHFAADAIVMWPRADKIGNAIANLRGWVLAEDPDEEIADAKVENLVAGGLAGAMWIQFELAITTRDNAGSTEAKTMRVSEVVDGGGKILAAAFAPPSSANAGAPSKDVPSPTPGGPLTRLGHDPAEAAATIRDGHFVAVFGLGAERARNPAAARALLGKLAATGKLALYGESHEVRVGGYGFVQAHLDLVLAGESAPRRIGVLLVARASGDAWSLASVHYVPLR